MDLRTTEILNRFSTSWNQTEKFYEDLIHNYSGWEHIKPTLEYILKFRSEGEDKFFRLGTSMSILMISRSVEFRLRPDQKFIKIETLNINDYEVTMRDGSKIFREYRIKSLEDVRLANLLVTLKNTLID